MINVPNESLEDWLSELKKYQRDQIREMLKAHNPVDVASLWIAANGPVDTSGFGGTGARTPFFEKFQEELHKFLCGDTQYDEERKQLANEIYVTKTVLISVISSAVAVQLGVMASLIVPAITIMLHIVGQVGINAWCANSSQ